MNKIVSLSHQDVFNYTAIMAKRIISFTDGIIGPVVIYPIPRGGVPVAYLLKCHFPDKFKITNSPDEANFLVDDIRATGKTAKRYFDRYARTTIAMIEAPEPETWYTFPWEVTAKGEDANEEDIIVRLLQYIGEDPQREGLRDTPKRVLKAWREWASGYGKDPKELLKTFEDGAANYDEMVIVHNIPVRSVCEHHMAPITGFAHVGYIPNSKIVGLSKLARVVDIYARRLQVQERMTVQIATTIDDVLQPKGVGVIIKAAHGCMSSRGVNIHGGGMTTTSAMRGALLEKSEARAEFLSLCHAAEQHK